MIANELVRRSVLKLLNCNSLRYWGLLVYNFEFIESDPAFCQTFMVGLINDRWHIWYNSEFVNTQEIGENIYVVIHEIIHAISGHCFRKAGRLDEFWSISTDHIININIDRDVNSGTLKELKKPSSRFIIKEIEDRYDWTAEMVYEWLQENGEIVSMGSQEFIVGIGSGLGQSSGKDSQSGEGESDGGEGSSGENVTITIEQKGVRIKSTGNIYPISMDLKMSDGADSQAAQSLAAQARAHANADRTRGLIGGNLRHLLKDIIDIQIPPERILENAIRAQLQKGEERSWRIPNKRLMAHGIVIPSVDMELQLSDVIFLNDHSGSISDKEIKMFSGVMKNCAQLFTKLHIIKHDYTILNNGGITVLDRDQLLSSKVLFEAVGRGGTSHKGPFKYVQEEFEKGTTISLVVGLTDWASDIQSIWDRFTFHKHIPVIWVVPYHVSVDPRYGKVLPIIEGRRIR